MIDPSLQPPPGAFPPAPPPPAPETPRRGTPAVVDGARGLLEAVRRRQRRQLWIEGALAGVATAVLLVLLGGFAALASISLARVLLIAAPLAGAAVALFFGVYLARREVGDDVRTARLIGHRIPEVSLDLVAAVELREALRKDQSGTFSHELANAYLASEDDRARQLQVERVVDPRRTRWVLQGAAGFALLVVITLAAGWQAWSSGLRGAVRVATGPAAERAREPITGDIEITYRYPAYTGLEARTVPGTSGELSAPAGTEVLLRTRADRDVERAVASVNGKDVPLEVTGARELEGSFVLDKAGSYSMVFQNARGRELARGPELPITVEADTPPQVALRAPGEQIEIDPGEKVTLRYEVSDDYGITELQLVFRSPGKAEETRLPLRHDEGRRSRDQFTWDLGALKLGPGDRVSYRVEAKDNDTVSGPKVGVSATHQLKIYSAAEKRREAVKRASELWESLVTHLADRMEGPDRAERKDAKKVEAHQQIDQRGMSLVGELREASQQIARMRDAPAELFAALSNIADKLRPRTQTIIEARRTYLRYVRNELPPDTASRRLARVTQDDVTQLEKDVLYLESLIDRQKLADLKEMAQQLAQERRELASLIEEFQKTQDPNLREDILLQIKELKDRINDLMQQMAELASGIRDEHLNAEALQEMMEEKQASSALDEIEKLMREGKADEALKKLQELAMQMEQMLENLEQGEQDSSEFSELAEKFGEFMNEMEQTRSSQEKVAEQTREIRDKYKEQAKQRLQERANALKDQLQKETAALKKSYQEVPPESLNVSAERPLEELQAELDNLENALKVDDFDLAAEAADRAQRAAEDLAAYGEQQRRLDELYERPRDLQQQSAQMAQQLAKDARRTEELNRKLQQLFPPPGAMMSEADRQKLRQLEEQQRQLERQAEGLGERMEEMQQMAPVFGPEAKKQMDKISERMGEAADRLQGRDPQRGHGEQRAALDQLQKFQEELKQQQRRGGGSGGGMPLPMFAGGRQQGSQQSREKVEIPGEEDFQAPKEFRKDILDAMKEGTPEKYKDQVKRFYEELVK